jgi:hypothetical protein
VSDEHDVGITTWYPPGLLPDGCELTATGMVLPSDLTFEDWQDVGPVLLSFEAHAERALTVVRWAIADWLRYGEHRFGEKYAQAVEVTGLSETRLMTLNWLADKVPSSRRREDLTIEHHVAVAALPAPQQESLLKDAAAHGWSVRWLKSQARDQEAENGGEDPDAARAKYHLALARESLERLDCDVAQALVQLNLLGPMGWRMEA